MSSRMLRPAAYLACAFLSGFILESSTANAAKDWTIYQPYVSTRAEGMGNAFTAVADDYSTLLYNPAGLARLKAVNVNLGIQAMMDSKTLKFEKDISKVTASKDINQVQSLLDANYGKHYSIRAMPVSGFVVGPQWGLVVIPADLTVEMGIHQLAGAALDVIGYEDTTIAYGRGWNVKGLENSQLSFGVTGKSIYRIYTNKTLLASDLLGNNSTVFRAQDADEGITADADAGMLWTPVVNPKNVLRFFKPTLGFTVHNIIDEGFATNPHWVNKNSGRPAKLERRYNLGTMFELPDFWIFKTRMAADLSDMGHENWSFRKGSHVGFEFLWKVRSWWQGGWRVGLNQGYFTAGFTGTAGVFTLDIATYAEETGPTATPLASRRYMAKASFDF